MDDQKQKLIERINQAQNILVTVSTNPSVDQLASAIGLSLALNKLNKHATAVFSGQVPSTIEFLKPEDTLEKNTDSLRDFIIALDKSKADKLRYKVEDQVVRIFITPYRTSITEKDLNFSQGDFNVDVVIALGVTEQQDLDSAITAHGRILHDATVASVTNTGQGSLGTINWVDPQASSLSEMVSNLATGLDAKIMDNQIATALLTGIVASTDRFSNEKTTPKTMSASAVLMAAGADPKLVATELATPEPTAEPAAAPADAALPTAGTQDSAPDAQTPTPDQAAPANPTGSEPGTLAIDHAAADAAADTSKTADDASTQQIQVDENGELHIEGQEPQQGISAVRGAMDGSVGTAGVTEPHADSEVKRSLIMEPPKMGDPEITAAATPEAPEPSTEELTLPAVSSPLLSHGESVLKPLDTPAAGAAPTPQVSPAPQAPPAPTLPPLPPVPAPTPTPAPAPTLQPAPPAWRPPEPPASATTQPPAPDPSVGVDAARDAVQAAFNNPNAPQTPPSPLASLNAQPLGPDLRPADQLAAPAPALPPAPSTTPAPVSNPGFNEPTPGSTPADAALDMPLPSNPFGPGMQMHPRPASPSAFPGTPPPVSDGPAPPPVPPPMFPPQQL